MGEANGTVEKHKAEWYINLDIHTTGLTSGGACMREDIIYDFECRVTLIRIGTRGTHGTVAGH
eukprot:scaffold362602_cov18-Prasinocladus_malaysianus.AAC.1